MIKVFLVCQRRGIGVEKMFDAVTSCFDFVRRQTLHDTSMRSCQTTLNSIAFEVQLTFLHDKDINVYSFTWIRDILYPRYGLFMATP